MPQLWLQLYLKIFEKYVLSDFKVLKIEITQNIDKLFLSKYLKNSDCGLFWMVLRCQPGCKQGTTEGTNKSSDDP